MRKLDILQALKIFVNQRPGFDLRNYDSVANYRSDYRHVLRAKNDFKTMLEQVIWDDNITADNIIKSSKHAFSGRLTIKEIDDHIVIDYCAGQYFPTEYRAAACAVLGSVLWNYWRQDVMKNDTIKNKGNFIHKLATKNFNRGIASRWFN